MTETAITAAVGLLVMVLGQIWRMPTPGGTRDAPLTQAAAVALAISTTWPVSPEEPDALAGLLGPLLLLVVAVLGVALARREVREALPDLVRLVTSALLAGLLVRLPGPDGTTLLQAAEEGLGRPVVVAGLLLVVTVVAVLLPLCVNSALVSLTSHTSVRRQILDDLFRHGALALATATATSSVVIALGLRVLGPASLVLFLLPLALLQPTVARQRETRIAQRQTIGALARLTDQAGLTAPGHGERVARLVLPVAREVGVDEADLPDVEAAALLHDLGQVALPSRIPGGATTEVSARDQRQIAAAGAAILARTAQLSALSAWVADVGVPHHRAVERGDVALVSRVIRVVSAYDDLTGRATRLTGAEGPVEALDRLVRAAPHEYDPLVVQALLRHLERRGVITPGQRVALRH